MAGPLPLSREEMMGCFGQRWVAAGPSRISESSKLWEVAINVSVDEAGSPGWSTHQNPQDYVNHGGQKGVPSGNLT